MILFVFVLASLAAQTTSSYMGELRLTVTDDSGLPIASRVEVVSESNQIDYTLQTDRYGALVATRLPFGRYQLRVSSPGFALHTATVDVQSILPTQYAVRLTLAPLRTQVTVTAGDTLLDVRQSGTAHEIGARTLQGRMTAMPGRSLSDVVNTQPGWLLEANGILHPRGSEYQVQYVLDGLPMTDNRSPAFAPELDADDVQGMRIVTGGFPAEYGRKLGGVVEVTTAGQARRGIHGSATGSFGSFGTAVGSMAGEYGWPKSTLGASGSVSHTDRYLDPPVEENLTNSGTSSNVALRFEHQLADADRAAVVLRRGRARFDVPNELVQERAGQRQHRTSDETAAQFSYQRLLSPTLLGDVRGMARDVASELSSNARSTPILPLQDRGFRELYLRGSVSGHAGRHEWKAGADADFGSIRERFSYEVTDPSRFDPDTPREFAFDDRTRDREQALFVQDQIRFGNWTVNAGLRWDRYRLLVGDTALSPRAGVAWSWPAHDLVFRASYDRAFQTPAIENLLLASAADLRGSSGDAVRLPVMPSRGNFYEAGVSKRVAGKVRVDVTRFWRRMGNFADDDLLLNTGVSFPIAFDKARITGTEVKLDLPRWHAASASLSYSNMRGVGFLPITGGLLLDDSSTLLTSADRFPISQDQRHTVRGRVSCDLSSRVTVSAAGSYGSGLPVEFTGTPEVALEQYGPRILDRVDLEAGRVRPSAALDASASAIVLHSDRRTLRIQADVRNLTGRLNVINFAGLFSGTAIGPPRSAAVRVQLSF